MGIQFAVHTYGYHDAMFYVLNGIKMIMNSDFSMAMIKFMALVTTGYYSIKGIATAAQGGTGHYFMKTTGMLILITALLMPKADMLVVDRISGKKEKVDDIPDAFVLPVGILEAMGAGITSLFEQAFAPVSSMPYKDYGLIFGQRLVQESKNWRIGNPEFARNMNTFIKRCVVLEAMIGTRFTPDDVFDSTDILGLVTERAGTFREVDFRIGGHHRRLNCKEAGAELKKYLKPEVDFLKFKYKNTEFSLAGGSGGMGMQQLLTKNLEVGYATSFGIRDQSAADIIRQNLMINAIKDWGNISDVYGYTRANDLQKSNWKIAGDLAKEYLPLLLNIMKALIYASFIFMMPLMILSGGMSRYLKYCTVVFSLQIWPALNAVLNLFIELYGSMRGVSLVGGGITYTNFNSAYDSQEGATQVQTPDGSILRTFANGSSSMSSGAGVNLSSGSRSLMLESGKASNLTEGYTQGLSAIKGLEQHFQDAQTATVRTATDRISHLAQRQAAGEALNIDTSTDEGRAMNQAINNTIALHDKEGYGWNQAAGATVKAHAGVGGSIFGVSGGVSTEGNVSANNTSDQALGKDNSINRENGTNHSLNTLLRAATGKSYTKDDTIDQSLANSTAASHEKMQNYGETLSQKREEVENYSLALQATQHKAATDRRDMTHEVEDKVMKQYGVSREAAHEMVQTADPRAQKVWQGIVEAETAKELAAVKASKQHVENTGAQDAVLFKNEHSGKVNNQGITDLQKEAAKDGLDANVMNARIQGTKGDINDKQTEMTANANNQIHSVAHNNKVMESGMNDKVNQYEKDRIGQGWTADKIGKVSGIFGGGSNIGAPTIEQRGQGYLKGTQKAPQISQAKSLKPKGEQE